MRKILAGVCLLFIFLNLSFAAENDSINVEVLAETNRSWNNQQLPHYPGGIAQVTILRITIPAGMELPMHKHPVINAGIMLKGELTVVTEDSDILHLKEGDAIVEVVDKWHYGINEGKEPAEIVVFYAGEEDSPITINY